MAILDIPAIRDADLPEPEAHYRRQAFLILGDAWQPDKILVCVKRIDGSYAWVNLLQGTVGMEVDVEISESYKFYIDGNGSPITTGLHDVCRFASAFTPNRVSLALDVSDSVIVRMRSDLEANFPPTSASIRWGIAVISDVFGSVEHPSGTMSEVPDGEVCGIFVETAPTSATKIWGVIEGTRTVTVGSE